MEKYHLKSLLFYRISRLEEVEVNPNSPLYCFTERIDPNIMQVHYTNLSLLDVWSGHNQLFTYVKAFLEFFLNIFCVKLCIKHNPTNI